MSHSNVITFYGVATIVGLMLFWWGCDTVPRRDLDDGQHPSVYGLEVVPEEIDAGDLASEQIQDSVAHDTVEIAVQAEDEDGEIERVVFTIEPASNPERTGTGILHHLEENRYGRGLILSFPLAHEVYTIRVFAVDDDSLESNQGIGRVRFVPES